MIKVKDALALERVRMTRKQIRTSEKQVVVNDNELMGVDFLEATIESVIRREFTGEIFDVVVPLKFATEGILAEFKKRCEAAGWQVRMYRPPNEQETFRIVIAAGELPGVDEGTEVNQAITVSELPPLALPPVWVAREPHVLIRMPTRGRPAQALSALAKYRSMAGMRVAIEVVIDNDDQDMLRPEVMQRLAALGCIVTVGCHGNKVEACNGGRVSDWDILVLASDDMVPVVDGYAMRIAAAMEQHFPHFDGAVFFNDGYQKSNLCTLPILGRRLYAQFGFVYDFAYKSLFCDQEQTDFLKSIGRLEYIDEKIIEHRHHVWGWCDPDELYKRNDALESEDRKTFEARKQLARFGYPQMELSILVCSLPQRRAQLEWLIDHVYDQIINLYPFRAEVVVDDRRGLTVGQKRQALLERAKGEYVAFVDDDDIVPFDYVSRVISGLHQNERPDALSLEGVMTTDGAKPERFVHSLHVEEWHTKDRVHYRSLNHLNVVKRELALQAGFGDEQVGEDHAYSRRLKELVKTEGDMGDAPLYIYCYRPTASVQAGVK